MSTKTSIKRIALVAVSALGFGVLAAVPQANAVSGFTASSFSVTQLTTARTNAPVVLRYTFNSTQDGTLDATEDTITVAARFAASLPAANTTQSLDDILMLGFSGNDETGGTANLVNLFYKPTAVNTTTMANGVTTDNDVEAVNDNAGAANYVTYDFDAIDNGADTATYKVTGYAVFTPATAGNYSITLWNDADESGAINGSETARTVSFTVKTEDVSSCSVSTYGTIPTTASDDTTLADEGLVKVRLVGSDGKPALPTTAEFITVTAGGSAYFEKLNDASTTSDNVFVEGSNSNNVGEDYTGSPQQANLNYFNFNFDGSAYLTVANGTAESSSFTVTTSSGGVTCAATQAFATGTAITADGDGVLVNDAATGIFDSAAASNVTDPDYTVPVGVSKSHTFYVGADTASDKYEVEVIDITGEMTGLPGANYTLLISASATANTTASTPAAFAAATVFMGSFSLTVAPTYIPESGANLSIQGEDEAAVQTITAELASTRARTWDDQIPSTSFTAVNGSTVTLEATLLGGYGVEVANDTISIAVTGRNATATNVNKLTDAAGLVTYDLVDSASSTGTSSSVTFTDSTGVVATFTITWAAAVTASTITTSPAATTTAANNPSDLGGVNTATATASTGRDSITATLKDANGVGMPGVPVTLTLPADVSLHTGSTLVEYTDSSGIATWEVFTTKAGTYAFTFTGGGLTATSYGKWTGSNGRVVKVTAGTTSNGVTPVTIKVEDAYGNGVPSVSLTVTGTGGYFQGFALSSTQSTNNDGEILATWVGSGTVTATGTATQMYSAAGISSGTTAAAGFPAGVASASATITAGATAEQSAADAAADAAGEAIDAANAATDAANLAAEAADAATVAAEEARDAADAATAAVEELATQVATLMAALKAQITTLANTVAKIAKKVRA